MSDPQKLIEVVAVALIRLVEHPAPAFICADPSGKQRYLAIVKHSAEEPAEPSDQRWLREQLGEGDFALQTLYGIFNGALLFEPLIPRFNKPPGTDGGFRYFPLRQLRTHSRDRIRGIDPESPLVDQAFAFAEIPLSANLLCVRRAEDGKVEVIQLHHEATQGEYGEPLMVEHLFAYICREPAEFLVSAGGYTFYSDGETAEQWHPIRYVPDARNVKPKEVAKEPLPAWWPHEWAAW